MNIILWHEHLRRKVSRGFCEDSEVCHVSLLSFVDSRSMQKFLRTITQECGGSIIYQEVVFWDVYEVFAFLSNRARVIRY